MWINIPYIERLLQRFTLSERKQRKSAFVLSPIVSPITNVDELLKTPRTVYFAVTPSGPGWLTVATVPVGKRWHLHSVNVSVTGSASVSTVAVLEASKPAGQEAYIASPAASGAVFAYLAHPVTLDAEWGILIYVATYTSGNVIGSLIIEEEDAY